MSNSQVICWESIISSRYDYTAGRLAFSPTANPYESEFFIPVAQRLDLLYQELKKRELDADATVHIIPYCLEDEGEQYVKTIATWSIKTISYVNGLLDFIDLKK